MHRGPRCPPASRTAAAHGIGDVCSGCCKGGAPPQQNRHSLRYYLLRDYAAELFNQRMRMYLATGSYQVLHSATALALVLAHWHTGSASAKGDKALPI